MTSEADRIKDAAFYASVTSLTENIAAYGTEIINFEEGEQIEWIGEGSLSETLCIVTNQLPPWPIISAEDASYCKNDPQITLDVIGRAMDILAFTRTWKKAGTKAPPVSLITTCEFTYALLKTYGINAQDFADEVWGVSAISLRFSQGPGWRSPGNINKLIGTDFDGYPIRSLPAGAPWMAGDSSLTSLVVDALELGKNVIIRNAPHRNTIEVRFDSQIPNATATGLEGKSFAEMIDHPLAKRIDARVVKVQQFKRSTRVGLEIDRKGRRKLGSDPKPRADYQRERKKLATARKKLQSYALSQLTPPVAKADKSLVDGDVDKLGICC